jgi:hypothetical protein
VAAEVVEQQEAAAGEQRSALVGTVHEPESGTRRTASGAIHVTFDFKYLKFLPSTE